MESAIFFAPVLSAIILFASVLFSRQQSGSMQLDLNDCRRLLDFQLFDRGIACLEKRLPGADPSDRIHEALGVAFFKMGSYEKAMEHFQKELTLNPQNMLSRFFLGTVLMSMGKPNEASRLIEPFLLDEGLRKIKNNGWERKFLRENQGLAAFVMGLIHTMKEKRLQAENCFKQAMEEGYPELDCLFLLLHVAPEGSDRSMVPEIRSRISELDPERLEAPLEWYSQGFRCTVEGILSKRPLIVRYLYDSLQKLIVFMDASAKNAVNEGKIDQALQIWKRALSIAPNDFMLNYNYSLMLTLSHPQNSLESLRHCLRATKQEHSEHLADALNLAGNIYFGMKRYQDATGFYSRSLALDPDHITAHSNLGAAWKALGESKAAEKEWLWVVDHIHVQEKEQTTRETILGEKIEVLVDVKEIGPYIEACESLADYYSENGDKDKAILFWERIIRASPEHGDVCFHLGEYFFEKKEREKASFFLEKAVLNGTRFQNEAEEYLQKIPGKKSNRPPIKSKKRYTTD